MTAIAQPMATLEVSCQVLESPPTRLFVQKDVPQYHVQAFPACRPNKTVAYVGTRSPAIVAYIMGSDWRTLLDADNIVDYGGIDDNWTEDDEEKLAMRIIQAGGTVLDTTIPRTYSFDTQRTEQFAAFSRTKKYVFGWPPQGGLWVLQLDGRVPWESWQPD
ncbi:hypothetical protein IQ06DRAFT_292184 [Phaeosphaeriaceae sp. SRC1lsM3a]|nr:hypothetical protein IQ06DRAFT_292184 [Stagonospora sp. SRC1lsM3a]